MKDLPQVFNYVQIMKTWKSKQYTEKPVETSLMKSFSILQVVFGQKTGYFITRFGFDAFLPISAIQRRLPTNAFFFYTNTFTKRKLLVAPSVQP